MIRAAALENPRATVAPRPHVLLLESLPLAEVLGVLTEQARGVTLWVVPHVDGIHEVPLPGRIERKTALLTEVHVAGLPLVRDCAIGLRTVLTRQENHLRGSPYIRDK